MKSYQHKIPDGKLIKIEIEIKKGAIHHFQLSGDFFLYPEEKIELLEKAIIGHNYQTASKALSRVIKKEKITLLGFEVKNLLSLVKQAFENQNYER
jgi:lipoate-protein ligase A